MTARPHLDERPRCYPEGDERMSTEDEILKSVLEEYVYRRFEVIGSGDPEWFRHFLADRGWDVVLVARSERIAAPRAAEAL